MDSPKITIVTVCYNAAATIEKTMQSVINQTYENIEYIIIDGGSIDGTVDIIKKYADKIAYWVSEPDKGIYDAMNKGIKVATGEWINFMNAGDEFTNDTVLSDIFNNPIGNEKRIVYGNINHITHKRTKHVVAHEPEFIKKNMPCCHQGMFVRQCNDIFFNLKYKVASEYDVIFRCYMKYGVNAFKHYNVTVCDFDGNDGISSRYPVQSNQECIMIRSCNKDIRWYYDFFKLIIKKMIGMK